ncbi:unnamed protein product, partial [Adineta ricciae]
IIGIVFIGILILPIAQERLNHSKDLQLLTNLPKKLYWFSNIIFDTCLCLILSSLLTIILKIGSIINSNPQSEVQIYRNIEQIGYYFLIILMFSLASIPMIYVYSFIQKSEFVGFTTFFIINILACLADMTFHLLSVVKQIQVKNATNIINLSNIMNQMTWVIAVLFPCVNFKRSLYNIRLKSDKYCTSVYSSVMFTNYSLDNSWMSIHEPGIGILFIIFSCQIIFWYFILILIENRILFKGIYHKYWKNKETGITKSNQWNNTNLDEDVRNERELIINNNIVLNASTIFVRDLVQEFKKRKEKSIHRQSCTIIDHLNFYVPKQSCFGLLGANGAGKTTLFRMLIGESTPVSGDIFINGENINRIKENIDIGYCPQFNWLINNLTVIETIVLFARLKGFKWTEISQLCSHMLKMFDLDLYTNKQIQELSGGNKRKVSTLLAFMGKSMIVLLDEPTTGLDAFAKRKLWNIIRAAHYLNRTVILTSHSMEECEALCTKIGIMKSGQLMCLGNLQKLKQRFGNGYLIQVQLSFDSIERFIEDLLFTFPRTEIQKRYNGTLFCTIPFLTTNENRIKLSLIFRWFYKKKKQQLIHTFAIKGPTLEEIFIRLVGENRVAMDIDSNEVINTYL